MQKILVKGSPKVQFRTVAIVSAGAALLTFIGYLLIKSERKKPKKKHTTATTQINKDDQQETQQHVIIEMEPVIKSSNTDILNEPINGKNSDENMNKIKCKLSGDENDEKLFNKSTQMPLTCSINNVFDHDNRTINNNNADNTNSNSNNNNNNNNDKLSETSSDSGNGTSDLNNINSPNGVYEYIHNAGEYSNDDDCDNNCNGNLLYKNEKKLDLNNLNLLNNDDISKLDTPPPTPTTTEAPQLPLMTIPQSSSSQEQTPSIDIENNEQTQTNMSKSTSSHSVTSTTTSAQDTLVYEFHFPRKLCGKLIGKNGVHVDSIRKKAHVQVAVRDDVTIDELQIVSITGYITNVEKALDIINERFPARYYPKISLKPIRKLIYKHSSNQNNTPNTTTATTNNNNNHHINKNKNENNNNKVLLTSLSFVELPYVNMTTSNSFNNNNNNNNVYNNSLNGYCFDVHVSAIVNSSHIFIQIPSDPTYNLLQRLDEDMFNLYNSTSESIPDLQEPFEYGTICAAPTSYGWHRAMITNYYKSSSSSSSNTTNTESNNDDCDMVTVKFLDYGGYLNVPVNQVKQLRSDFMALPFQAIEVYLDNIQPIQGHEEEGKEGLTSLTKNSFLKAIVTGYTDDSIPLLKLFKLNTNSFKSLLINNELVSLGYAQKLNYEINDNNIPSPTNGTITANEPIITTTTTTAKI